MTNQDSIYGSVHPILSLQGLVSCWDFSGESPLLSKEGKKYQLKPGEDLPRIIYDGVVGKSSVEIEEGNYLFIPRKECPGLNIHGKDAQVTILAWVKRNKKSHVQCEAVAGMWNETNKKRQYCLFLNLRLFESADQVCGHISGVGGPTPGEKYCIDASIGTTAVEYGEWSFVAFTYDGKKIESYLDGKLDARAEHNPYNYPEGIFDGGDDGSDFTVGAVHRSNEMGNFFTGLISCLAVFNRALTSREIKKLHEQYPINK